MQNETNMVAEAIDRAYAKGMKVAFNASPIQTAIRDYPLQKVRWLFINEIEGEALSGESDPQKMLCSLRKKYPTTEVILTLGEKGSIWGGENGTVSCKALQVQALDTTGAGDTFTGFFLRGVLDPVQGVFPLTLAGTASAIAVTRAGAAKSIPDIEEVKDWLKRSSV
ncbi:MAG: PfkB family carbohydrate kinase [Oscillibacter sp.]|nr:PfkB family carbohydrate kinase [Oscillibacter sp.]